MRRILCIVLAAAATFMIFHYSSETSAVSTQTSQFVFNELNKIAHALGVSFDFLDGSPIRKDAHFTEYFLQGIFLCAAFSLCSLKRRTYLGYVLFVCLFTAVCDEYLQLFSPGRSSEIADVLLDFKGSSSGILFFLLMQSIWQRWQCRKRSRRRNRW
ncbi:VanZ like family protein [Propionispira arboris]|uniref:VanZ like family protein n=1 Tax=Propionispira arboris TaxID=84035 RepID=A0A1H6UE41_9FIRM|nr:VanZ family protein [Propionispira arboris]SEI86450.1 VanZ like family protein [Propionispira arboris]